MVQSVIDQAAQTNSEVHEFNPLPESKTSPLIPNSSIKFFFPELVVQKEI